MSVLNIDQPPPGARQQRHRITHVPHKAHTRGWTLIELLIVLAVVAVLALFAFPVYQNSVHKARRLEARTALLELAARQERYRGINNTYADTPAELGLTSSVKVGSTAYYRLELAVNSSAGTFTASAVPLGPQTADPCGTYSVDYRGLQRNADASGSAGNCW